MQICLLAAPIPDLAGNLNTPLVESNGFVKLP
jgi:hypothetical protein